MTQLLKKALILIACFALSTGAMAEKVHKSHGKQRHSNKGKSLATGSKAPTSKPANGIPYSTRPEVMQQALDIAQRRDLDPTWVSQTLGQAQALPSIARLMLPPPSGTPKNWRVYRSRFVEPIRIAAGVAFWRAQRDWLQRAEQSYGVPADIIVGIRYDSTAALDAGRAKVFHGSATGPGARRKASNT